MKKFLFVYYNGQDASEWPMEKVHQAWSEWFGEIGDQLVEAGNPFADNGHSVQGSGIEKIPADMWPASGYSLVEAGSMEEATEIAKGCPILEQSATGAIRVFEALPM